MESRAISRQSVAVAGSRSIRAEISAVRRLEKADASVSATDEPVVSEEEDMREHPQKGDTLILGE